MKSRRQAREAALQALYMCDTISDYSDQAIDLFFNHFRTDDETSPLTPAERDCTEFARALALGAMRHVAEIDREIAGASTHWSVARMSRVDRNILRCAAYEIAYRPDVPVNVCIDEAIEIAKRYGTDDSPMFVNGVLDHFASIIERQVDGADVELRVRIRPIAANS